MEPASLPFTSTCQKPNVTYLYVTQSIRSPYICHLQASPPTALRQSPLHIYPSVSTELTLAQHCIDHGRGRDCYLNEKYGLPTTYLRRHRVENVHLQYEHRQTYTHTHMPAHTHLCKTNINMHIPTDSVITSIKLC